MTINEIAKMAGVSSAAVSRYFNQGYISEEKREAIRRVVEKTGYSPSVQAQMLRTKRTKMIGIIIPRVNNGAIGSMVDGILPVLDKRGYQILLADTQNDVNREIEYLTTFDERRVDGIIFIGTVFTAEHKKLLKKTVRPLVIVGQHFSGCHCVYQDEYNSVYDMTRLLIDKGRTKLGYISAPMEDDAAGLKRYQGYCAAVKEAGLAECGDLYEIAGFRMEQGYDAAARLWNRAGNLDGIVCATDLLAIGTMMKLRESGIRVPEDVMITGHGDSGYSKVTTPTLTTVHYEYAKAGAAAAQMLLDLIDSKELAMTGIMMEYKTVERESTGGNADGLSFESMTEQ